MQYREISPGQRLKSYVKCFYIYESDSSASFEDTVFPSGCIEIIFNLGEGKWQTLAGTTFVTTPAIELWGQITKPLAIRSIGKNVMLGVRFLPHGIACFLQENIDVFNNQITSLKDLSGDETSILHIQLLESDSWQERIGLLENFLLSKFSIADKKQNNIAIVGDVMDELKRDDFFDNIQTVASRYGITSRYLQKLFLQYTGLTPKLYSKINRFQNSLKRISKNDTSLTSIAYDCGYFDQSHFIREFKSFTGLTPSGYTSMPSPITVAAAK